MLLAGKRLLALMMTVLLLVTALPITVLSEEIANPTPIVEEPIVEPTEEPIVEPTEEPIIEPTEEPIAEPTEEPIAEPTEEPIAEPTEEPIAEPTAEPTVEPTAEPTEEPAPVLVSEIVLDPAAADLYAGATLTVNAVVTPADAADLSIVWTSSDETVATVDENGVVTALKAGQAVVTATAGDMGGAYAECAITVVENLSDLSIEGVARMQVGVEYQISAISGEKAVDNGMILWTSSDETIATVSENGVVVGAKPGNVIITAAANDASGLVAELAVEVIPATVYIETSSNRAFSKAVSENNNEQSDIVSINAVAKSSSEFAAMRLIAEVKSGKEIDVVAYNPTKVIRNKDNRFVLQFSTIEETEAAYDYLSSLKKVEYVTPDSVVTIDTVDEEDEADLEDSAKYSFNSWGAERMGADVLNGYSNQPTGTVTVAIIDTGISAHSFIGNKRVLGYDYVDSDNNPSDEHGHGTHVAGTVVDLTQALNVKVAAYRVLDANGRGYTSDICNAIRDAADDGCKVMNLSLGGKYSSTGYNSYYSAISYAISKGATVCVAAGNDSDNTSNYVPACIDLSGCIVVSSIDSADDLSYFSNYGSSVDVAAPGSYIRSCNYTGGYTTMSGTSMATPHVAAACAATILYTGVSTPSSVQSKVQNICEDLGTSGWDSSFGYGVPQMNKLYTAPGNPTPGNPTPGNPTPGNPTPGVPTLSVTSVTIGKKMTYQLNVTGNKGPVTWSTANKKIAKVSSTGLVTAKKKLGTTTITASVDGYNLQCTVKVSKPKLSTKSLTITARMKENLSVLYSNKSVKWKSSNTSVATVNKNGKVTAKKAGSATITATVDGATLKCKVTVKANQVKRGFKYSNNDFYYGYGVNYVHFVPHKVYYDGSSICMDAYVYNNSYSYGTVTKFANMYMELRDGGEYGDLLAVKTFNTVKLNVGFNRNKKVTLKFNGSATHNKNFNFTNRSIDDIYWRYRCTLYYRY